MKKALVVCSLALLSFIPASAQFSWGIRGGVNSVSNDITNLSDSTVFNKESYTGYFIGPMVEIQIPIVGLGVDASILYSQKGMTLPNDTIMKNQSISIPLSLKYSFGLGNAAAIFVAAGPQFDYKISSLENTIKNYKESGDFEEAKYELNKYTWSVNVGAGVKLFSHLQAAVNYNIPLSEEGTYNLFSKEVSAEDKIEKANGALKASTLQFVVTWTF